MKRINAIAVAISVFFPGVFPSLNGQTKGTASDAVAAITRLENEGVKASLGNPREFVEKNVADDFVGGTSFGKWETKADQLKDDIKHSESGRLDAESDRDGELQLR